MHIHVKKSLFHFYFESQENCVCYSQSPPAQPASIGKSSDSQTQKVPGASTTSCVSWHERCSTRTLWSIHLESAPQPHGTTDFPHRLCFHCVPYPPVSFFSSSNNWIPTPRSRLDSDATIFLVNYTSCQDCAKFFVTLSQPLPLSYTILVLVIWDS